MPQDPFPLPPGDAEEPGSSPLPPAAEGEGEDWDGLAEQGLYVCLPPEQLTLAGFAPDPGPPMSSPPSSWAMSCT
jgi:hypothetical protein